MKSPYAPFRPMKAIIVEDEPAGLKNLQWKIEQDCPELEIISTCRTGQKAIDRIRTLRPDVVFLDIRLDDMTGFDVLAAVPQTRFEVIITTAYDEYAIKAIKNRALDYLLKPIKREHLREAIDKLLGEQRLQVPRTSRIGLPINTGEKYVAIGDILYLEAQNTRCKAYVFNPQSSKQPIEYELTRLLGDMEQQLGRYGFGRPNQTFLVNLQHIQEYLRKDGGWIVMTNQKPINITATYRDRFHQFRKDWELLL
ncbi:MAG: LytTR family DNA-binding domain-containing protein [Bacteroidota bacterium]